MEKKINFLKPGINQIRQSILDIDDSYNNPWDILAELCQNSLDAIRKRETKEGKLVIKIDCSDKSISVSDNGTGIEDSDLPNLLGPFSTNKRGEAGSVGEKGVGLTFAIFSCNNFFIDTRTSKSAQAAQILDAENWKKRTDDMELKLELLDSTRDEIGTEVTLKKLPSEFPLFNLRFEQLKYILRTKTAVGSTLNLFNEDIKLKIIFQYKDENGKETIEELPFKYWLFHENLDKNSKVSLDEFIAYASDAQRTDQDKRRFLVDKLIYDEGQLIHNNNRTIKYQAFFVPKSSWFDKISIDTKLCSQENLNDENWLNEYFYTKFTSGITTSVKGMPTGIAIIPPNTGFSGYWRNIFIIFEDRYLSFDIGRKSIHGSQANILRNYAKEIFNKYIKIAKYVAGDIQELDTGYDKQEMFEEINELPDIKFKFPKIIWKKTPKNQEASIAGLYYQCIGSGIVKDITPLVSGYRNKYDLYAKWGKKNVVIEFKSSLSNIFKDFSDERKMFDEIDCIVCWEITDNDNIMAKKRGVLLEKIEPNPLARHKEFPNATHRLILANVKSIYVVDLKQILVD